MSLTCPSCRAVDTQAHSLDELLERVREAILLCLEVMSEDEPLLLPGLVDIQRVAV